MKLEDLERTCLKQRGCENCPATKECKKWKNLRNECTEPWEMKRFKESFETSTPTPEKKTFNVELSADTYNFLWCLIQEVHDDLGKDVTEEDMVYESLSVMESAIRKGTSLWNN